MDKTRIVELYDAGQSAWLDQISRPLIEKGGLEEMIALGLKGITSNPTIFDKAISKGSDYDQKIKESAAQGLSTFEIYDNLTVKDIQEAADLLSVVYNESNRKDGYVSLEVNPQLAYNTEETIEEAKRLWTKVKRPNLMLKIPATEEGFRAIEEILAQGMNVNATLIFSLEQYKKTAASYMNGLKRFLEIGGQLKNLHSVASVFVSRIDSVIDRFLDEMIIDSSDQEKVNLELLKGKAAVSNSKLIYKEYLDIFSSNQFKSLKQRGANLQRVLWASTSTKSPAYSDIKYVTELIGKNTVNTLPEATFQAFLDHGVANISLDGDILGAKSIVDSLGSLGIDLNQVCQELLEKGVIAFQGSFDSLLQTIDIKEKELCRK
ncbi:MAG: transaldolase [Candidatus Omnitrophica bacterium]|nr:transaldolase [Candidatus Omnitrophota bacterium]